MNSDTPRRNRISSLAQEGTRIPQVQGELRHSLLQVAGRLRQLRLWQALTLAWLLAAGLGVLLWMTGSHSADDLGLGLVSIRRIAA